MGNKMDSPIGLTTSWPIHTKRGWLHFWRSHCARRLLLMLASSVLLSGAAPTIRSQERNVVVVRPKEIQDVLVNPGMGITTFQRFNGQEPNPPLKWSEVGPEKRLPPAA